ncbi:MAG TPA: hypothetical protein PLG90_04830 [Ignavibacteria bacterium]|nr:hypothetical protein [Ignavibacteria bacterium]
MKENELLNFEFITIFNDLSKKYLKKFELFLRSPFFEIQPFTVNIFESLVKNANKLKTNSLTVEKIYSDAFPSKPFNAGIIRKGFSLLTNYYIQFITHFYVIEDEYANITCKIKSLNGSGNQALTKKYQKELETMLENYKLDFRLMHIDYDLNFVQKSIIIAQKNPRASDEMTVLLTEKLILYFLFNFVLHKFELETVTKLHNYKIENSVINAFNDSFDLEGFKQKLENVSHKNEFAKNLVLKFCKIFDTRDEKILTDFIEFIFKHKDRFEKFTFYALFFISVAYCSRFVFSVDEREKYILPYYQKYLSSENIWSGEKNVMVFKDYLEFIKISFRLDEAEWAKEFHNKYLNKIYKTHIEDAENYFNSQIYLYNKDYEKALQTINLVKNKIENILNEEVRRIKLICCYYLGYTEEALSLITSYKEYMKTTNIFPKEYTKNITDFLNYYKEILLNKENYTKQDWEYLLNKIKKEKSVRYKNFLIPAVESNILNSKLKSRSKYNE